MDPVFDPEELRDRAGVSFHEKVRRLSADEFDSVAGAVDDHAVIGITNDDGEVLLMNDGSHGWTLVAFPVQPGEDWVAVARSEAKALLDDTVTLEDLEFVRRVEFESVDDDSRQITMYTVVFRASVDDSVGVGSTMEQSDVLLGWFDAVPDEQEGDPADDIRTFLEE